MRKIIADTNIFLRFLLNDNVYLSEKAADLLQEAKSNKAQLYVPQIVIFEVLFALSKYYHLPKIQLIEKLEIILATKYIHIQNREIFQEAIVVFKEKRLDFVDCFLLCAAKAENASLFTFDKASERLARKTL